MEIADELPEAIKHLEGPFSNELSEETIKNNIPKNYDQSGERIVSKDCEKEGASVLSTKSHEIRVDSVYYDYLLHRYPNAMSYGKGPNEPVVVILQGIVRGVLLPIMNKTQ